jgi:hypothetical protein
MLLPLVSAQVRCGCRALGAEAGEELLGVILQQASQALAMQLAAMPALNLCLAAKQGVEARNLHPVTPAGSLPQLAAQADQLHRPVRPASLLGCGSSPVLHARTLHALADQGIKALLRMSQLPARGGHICCLLHLHQACQCITLLQRLLNQREEVGVDIEVGRGRGRCRGGRLSFLEGGLE